MGRRIEEYRREIESVGSGTRFGGPHITVYGGRKDRGAGISIGRDCFIYDYCQFHSDNREGCGISIGDNCHFNYGCYICGSGGLAIGNDCLFGPGAKIIPMNHRFDDLEKKIVDHRHTVDSFVTLLSNRREILKADDGVRSAFEQEMRRYLPSNVVVETVDNSSFWPYVTNLVTGECDQIMGLLSGNLLTPPFKM